MRNKSICTCFVLLTGMLLFTKRSVAAHNFQQRVDTSILVSGMVYGDSTNFPLPGATVRAVNGKYAVQTLSDGSFTIKVKSLNSPLLITYVGYDGMQYQVSSSNMHNIQIVLTKSKHTLDAVVVSTGYQSLPKERVSGSFETINNKTFNQRVTSTVLSRLDGISSVNFDKGAGRPNILIRGLSSINGSNAPLIVLNGFPFEGDFNRINPDDVESITILKDAAASSIWGTRAGNGVIVVTTKHAAYNQPLQVGFNGNFSVTQKPDLFYLNQMTTSDFIDVEQFLFSKGYYKGQENNRNTRPVLSPVIELLIKQRDGIITDAEQQIDDLRNLSASNSFKNQLYKNATLQQYNVNLKAGDQKGNFFLSAGYIGSNDELNTTSKSVTVNSEANYKFNSKLRVNVGLTFIQRNSTSGATSFQSQRSIYPYFQLTNPDGSPAGIPLYRKGFIDTAAAGNLLDWNYYPLNDYKHSYSKIDGQNMIGRLGINYNIIKNLSFSGTYQYERQNDQITMINDLQSKFTRDLINRYTQYDPMAGSLNYIIPIGGIKDGGVTSIISQNVRAQLNYNYSSRDITVNAIAGFEARDVKNTSSINRNYGFDENVLTSSKVDYVNAYPSFINGSPQYVPFVDYNGEKNNRFVSTYANAGITYLNRYIFTASARRDASNLFGVNTNDKWQPLWSTGLGWNLSNEEFYGSVLLPSLKFRATYGISGNVDLARSAVTAIQYGQPSQYSGYPLAFISQYANPDLRWEKSSILNFGVDFSFKNQIVSGSIDGYFKNGTDLYGLTPIDQTAGVGSTIVRNVGDMKGHGIEFNLNSNLIDRSFKWSSSFIFNYNRSKVTKYYQQSEVGANFISNGLSLKPVVGKPVFALFGYKWGGLDSLGNPMGIVNGKVSKDYYDITGNGTKPEDLVYGGSAIPQYFGSFINKFQYKKFTLTINITYKFGYSFVKNSVNYSLLAQGLVQSSDFAKRWRKPGDELTTDIPSMVYPISSIRETFYNNTEVLFRKGDHIRLSYVNLSYNLPEKLLKKAALRNLQLYFSASNLGLIWKKNKDGIDPDYVGISIPPGKTFSFGLQTTF